MPPLTNPLGIGLAPLHPTQDAPPSGPIQTFRLDPAQFARLEELLLPGYEMAVAMKEDFERQMENSRRFEEAEENERKRLAAQGDQT